jgi:hypothetical protein
MIYYEEERYGITIGFWEKSFRVTHPFITLPLYLSIPISQRMKSDIFTLVKEVYDNAYKDGQRNLRKDINTILKVTD